MPACRREASLCLIRGKWLFFALSSTVAYESLLERLPPPHKHTSHIWLTPLTVFQALGTQSIQIPHKNWWTRAEVRTGLWVRSLWSGASDLALQELMELKWQCFQLCPLDRQECKSEPSAIPFAHLQNGCGITHLFGCLWELREMRHVKSLEHRKSSQEVISRAAGKTS